LAVRGEYGFSAKATEVERAGKVEATRRLFKQVVEIPTVEGRGEVPRLVKTALCQIQRRGLTDISVPKPLWRDGKQ